MAHPKKTKKMEGDVWHLEDYGLKHSDAQVLARHLRHTEDKKARVIRSKDGCEVWWSK